MHASPSPSLKKAKRGVTLARAKNKSVIGDISPKSYAPFLDGGIL
jgi:hypothetical protein